MKFKTLTITLSCFFAFLLIFQPVNSQHSKKMTFNAGEVTLIAGLNALIKAGDNGLTIEMIPGKDRRDKAYKEVDLANQDKIIMCNGKKVKTIADLNEIMEAVEIGDEISFGVKRGNQMMIVSFPKADPKQSGNMMMMTTTMDDDGASSETSIMKDGVEMKDVVMLDAGLILKDLDNKVNILAVMPMFNKSVDGEAILDGDIIISFNGEKNLSAEDINKKYNALKNGDVVSITFTRESKEFTATFKKTPPSDNGAEVIIEK